MEFPFDENDSFETVYLSTRITQIENKMLQEIGGWLQTGNQTATIRKQEIVRHTIRMAYEFLHMQIADIDKQNADISTEHNTTTDITPTKQTHNLDLKIYQEIANKSITHSTHKLNFLK